MCLLNHLRYLNRQRWEPIVVLPDGGLLLRQINALGIRTILMPMEWWIPGECWHSKHHFYTMLRNLKGNVETLARVIEHEDVSIVHTNSIVSIDGALAAAMENKPHIWHIHENLLESETLKPYYPTAATFALVDLFSDSVIAVSDYLGKRLRNYISGEKIEVIRGGIPMEDFARAVPVDRHPLRGVLGCEESTLLVGTVGSVTKRKNPEGFVDIAAQVIDSRTDVMFVWIGNLTERKAAEAAIEKANRLKIAESVHFVGFQQSIRDSLNDIDLVIHPSFNENLSLACIEAMAAGKPVVATRCGGPEEVVVDGMTGFLVPLGDVDDFATRVLRLLSDAQLRTEMGSRGRLRALEFFDAARATRHFESQYERLLARDHRLFQTPAADLIPSLLELLHQTGELGFAYEHAPSADLLRTLLHRAGLRLKRKLLSDRQRKRRPPLGNGG